MKRNIGSQAMVNDVSELESNTNDFMKSLSDNPDHVKAYLDHASLSKYKLDWCDYLIAGVIKYNFSLYLHE